AKCLPNFESSFYFSAVTYATIGYSDLVLPKEWRMLGPIEGFTGILMFGLSTAFFFIVVSKSVLYRADERSPARSHENAIRCAGGVRQRACRKEKVGGARCGFANGAGDTQHCLVLIRVSGVDSKE